VELLVVRHAIAEDREVFAATGREDALRPLTAEGTRKMKRTARGLRTIIPGIDVLVSSPFARAHETAEILRREYELDRIETARELEPATPLDEVVSWLGRLDNGVVTIVGHEPQLGHLVTYLITGSNHSGVELKKGGACLIEFDAQPEVARGRLIWAIAPGILRDLAG
jgi:phosphohistidine phosphatase